MAKPALGRGLGALLGGTPVVSKPPPGTPARLGGELYISDTAALQKLLQPAYSSKISYQMSRSNRFVGFSARNASRALSSLRYTFALPTTVE